MENLFAWMTSIVGAGLAHMERVWDYHPGPDPSMACGWAHYGQAEEITTFTCSSEVRLLTSAGDDHGAIHIWNVRTRYAVLIYRETMSAVLDRLPDASLKISTSTERVLYFWDIWTSSCVQAPKQPGVGVYSSGSAS